MNAPSAPNYATRYLKIRRLPNPMQFQNTFAALPSSFYTKQLAEPMPDASLVCVSTEAANLLGKDAAELIANQAWREMLSAGEPLKGADPLAAVYAGHQFGVWAGRLGDGRALLLGEVVTPSGSLELQLKGGGKTPYSRGGDGYAVLRSSIRELLCSEAMAGLGIPTTRALSLSVSDRPVIRETFETSAVVCRMAPSFIRFGSFEYFCHFNRHQDLQTLADYAIDKFFPECRVSTDPYAEFVKQVTLRTAVMVARWQAVGFCHGVMNTDNMSILGLTIDYGPFGFLDNFDPAHICNHSDDLGRYSYENQPRVAHWNCYCLAQALMPLIKNTEIAEASLQVFTAAYDNEFTSLMRAKLGLTIALDSDIDLMKSMFEMLRLNRADFTLFFRGLASIAQDNRCRDLMLDWASFDAWKIIYLDRLSKESQPKELISHNMQKVNPARVLRNHIAETAISLARGDRGKPDFTEVNRLLKAFSNPFTDEAEFADLSLLPPAWASELSVSCSS
jgi:serine/tyrosine/threonine adenylyltransferase